MSNSRSERFKIGDRWEAGYCAGAWGTPEASGGRMAGRLIVAVDDEDITFLDRAGERHRTTIPLFEAWAKSQWARVVAREGGSDPSRQVIAAGGMAPTKPAREPRRRAAGSPKFLTVAQAADDAGVSVSAIYYHIRTRALPIERRGRAVLIPSNLWEEFKKGWQ